jgi:hypothetical protein
MLTMSGRGRSAGSRHRLHLIVAVVLMSLAVLAFWVWREGAEGRAIANLPADERAELYQRELASFRTLCGQGPRSDELQGQCRDKAKFIVEFPECDAACRALADSHREKARR